MSVLWGQRAAKRQPLVTGPVSVGTADMCFLLRALGSGTGTALSSARIGMFRIFKQCLGVGELDNLAKIHHRDPVADMPHKSDNVARRSSVETG